MSETDVKVPPWVIGLLLTLLLMFISAVFTAGITYSHVEANRERVDNAEKRIDSMEDRLLQLELRK